MFREFLIKLLFRLLDERISYSDINEKAVEEWLIMQKGNKGFIEYFKKRDIQILKTFPIVIGGKESLILAGQRLELFKLLERSGNVPRKVKPKQPITNSKRKEHEQKSEQGSAQGQEGT